jgi:hypothetical protein
VLDEKKGGSSERESDLTSVLDEKVFVAPLFELWVVTGVEFITRVLERRVEADDVVYIQPIRCEVRAAPVPEG